MIASLSHYPANPAYGSGAYRRRLQFVARSTGVTAQVDDTHHSFWLTLAHDGDHVTAIDAGFNRAPTTMCPGSVTGLKALIGLPLQAPMADLLAQLHRTANCSHLVDLALWTIAQRDESAVWDIEIPDQIEDPVWIEIARDGRTYHRWRIADFHVVEPSAFAGNPLMSGFMSWAKAAFDDDALLAATMLQRGIFVARGRHHVVDQGHPRPLAAWPGMAGMCWAYSGERLTQGTGALGYVRDFSDAVHPETSPPHVAERLKDSRS